MTHIRNAQGNNFSEVASDTINQVVGQFSEGINAMFAGFKSFGQNFSTGGFAPNGQQQSSHNTHLRLGGAPTADEIHSGMEQSKRVMDSHIPFGEEDLRAIGDN